MCTLELLPVRGGVECLVTDKNDVAGATLLHGRFKGGDAAHGADEHPEVGRFHPIQREEIGDIDLREVFTPALVAERRGNDAIQVSAIWILRFHEGKRL